MKGTFRCRASWRRVWDRPAVAHDLAVVVEERSLDGDGPVAELPPRRRSWSARRRRSRRRSWTIRSRDRRHRPRGSWTRGSAQFGPEAGRIDELTLPCARVVCGVQEPHVGGDAGVEEQIGGQRYDSPPRGPIPAASGGSRSPEPAAPVNSGDPLRTMPTRPPPSAGGRSLWATWVRKRSCRRRRLVCRDRSGRRETASPRPSPIPTTTSSRRRRAGWRGRSRRSGLANLSSASVSPRRMLVASWPLAIMSDLAIAYDWSLIPPVEAQAGLRVAPRGVVPRRRRGSHRCRRSGRRWTGRCPAPSGPPAPRRRSGRRSAGSHRAA